MGAATSSSTITPAGPELPVLSPSSGGHLPGLGVQQAASIEHALVGKPRHSSRTAMCHAAPSAAHAGANITRFSISGQRCQFPALYNGELATDCVTVEGMSFCQVCCPWSAAVCPEGDLAHVSGSDACPTLCLLCHDGRSVLTRLPA